MTIDEAEMPTDFPFNKLTLPADETVILTRSNPTFHRTGEQAVLISNKALYLGTGEYGSGAEGFPEFLKISERCKWRRFPLTEITCATLIWRDYSVASLTPSVLIGLLVAGLLLFASFKAGLSYLGWHLFIFGVAVLWFIASSAWDIIRGEVYPPCALRIEMDKESHTWRMPGDSYADEVDYDCWMVQSTLDKLAELGVKTATDL